MSSTLSLRFSNLAHSTAFSLGSSRRRRLHLYLLREINGKQAATKDKRNHESSASENGGAVHDVLERILNTTPSRSRIATAIVNLILNHCYLQMVGINLQLHLPISSDSFAYISELKELNAESLYFHQGCLLRGLVGLVFRPLKKSSFVMSGSGFEIGYKRNDHINHVCSSNELFACAKLDELQLVYFDIHSLELNILFSPVDLAIFAVLAELSPKGSKHVRNGRLLWKLASRRIGHVISAPSLSLHNLVTHVSLWLRYVNAYAHLLFLLGYSADHLLKRSALKISQDETFLASAKNNWEVITDIEIELPAEAIAQARRIARYRAAVNVQRDEDSDKKFSVSSHLKIFSKILPLLACVWKAMYRIFHLIAQLLFLFRLSTKDPESSVNVRQGIVSEYSYPQRCFCLNLEKLFITFYPEHSAEPVNQRLESQTGISYSDFLSFCLSVDALILMYTEDISEKSFLFSCGQLKVTSSSYIRAPPRRSSSMDSTASVKGHRKGRVTNAKIVLWGEPAEVFTLSETNKSSPTDHAEGAFDPVLEDFLGEMWFNWKRFCMKFDESEIEYSENPWLLCETKSFLTYPDLKNPDSGFWKCNLTVGKLNLALEYSSLLSMALLLRQIQHVATWTKGNAMPRAPSGSTPTIADQPEISCNDKFESCAGGIKMALCRMLPEKHIQIGVLIAGPHIQMSLRKIAFQNRRAEKNHLVGQDDFHLEFDVHNIKFVALPTSKSDSTSFVRILGSDDAKLECIRLQKPQIIAKSDDEKYTSQGWISICAYLRIDGLNTYLVDFVRNQQSLIFALKPISFHLSSSREYVHSLTTTVNAFAAALCGMAGGFTIISFIDEMHALFQVVAGLFSEVSYACNGFDSVIYVPFQEFIQQDIVSLEHENGESTVKGASFICTSTMFSLSGTFKLEPMDIFCHKYRIREKVSFVKNIDASSGKMFSDVLLDCGVWISVHQTCMDISCEEGKIEVLIDFSGIKSQLIRYEGHIGNVFDHLVFRNLLLQPHNCLHELFLSNCIFTMWFCRRHDALSPHAESDTLGGSHSGSNVPHSVGNPNLTSESEKSTAWSHHFVQKVGFDPNIFIPAPSHWLLLNIAFGEVLMTNCRVKNVLVGSHQFNKLLSSLSVGGEYQSVSCAIQGGLLLLEITALLMFVRCFSSYLNYIASLLSILQSSTEDNVHISGANSDCIEESAQGRLLASRKDKEQLLEVLTAHVSQLSLILVFYDESGNVRELVLDVDAHMKLRMSNLEKKFMIDFSRLSILSRFLQESMENESQIPHFSPVGSNDLSSHSVAGEGTVTVQYNNQNGSFNGASCSTNPVSQNEFSMNNCSTEGFRLSHQNYILNHLSVFLSAEKLENHWVGIGSISGFDMTISLPELQMIMSTVSSFYGISSKEMPRKTTERHQSIKQESSNGFKAMVPNGAIVAIQDVDQHSYFTVEDGENKYTLSGAIHYSLVGERALFRVKYHKQKRWMSSVLWFSLISLYAKNDLGEPLRLNYRSGSCFVDISSSDDSSCALWRMLPCDSESYRGDVDWEAQNQLVKDTFYLVNKKNDCAVAFIDGVPEFVKKPGNSFKFKEFNNLAVTRDLVVSDGYSFDASGTNVCRTEHDDEDKTSEKSGGLPCIHIKIDKVALTVVHELLDTKDRLPLLCACMSDTQIAVQSLSTKARVMSTSRALLSYFDAQRNLWRELVQPVEICIYHRSSFQIQGSKALWHRVPLRIYCRIKEIFLTELSLDILLFVVGKLDLAGPYLIRSSHILANCCKVENQSGLNLHCHFDEQQSVTVGRKQSASIFLRNLTLVNQAPDSSSVVSIQLSLGSFMTSSIYLSLLESRSLTWRTRIVSAQDSRTFPGPFIVVDISRTSEDGLSIVVSPLIRVHNETEFSMELRFRRVQEQEDDFASILLKPGHTIDDSMAMFDAVSFSGGLKKALMSLSVGNFLFSFRPGSSDGLISSKSSLSAEWSEELTGGKAVRLSGIFDKLSYEVRRALSVQSEKCSFSTAHCVLKAGDIHVASMHFLIQSIGRNVPIIEPDKSNDGFESRSLPIALQEQKEIFLLPTVLVTNLLHLDIHVLLSETDLCTNSGSENIGKQATIPCGSKADFYANPAIISSCKPLNSSDWVNKLLKHKNDVRYLDIDLDFGAGKYFASLRLSRGQRGILEATIFTSYTLRNETDVSLLFYAPNQKPLSWDEVQKSGFSISPEIGLLLSPKSTGSWFLKSHKLRFRLLDDHSSEALLDLDALSGLTEIKLEIDEGSGVKYFSKFGVSMGPSSSKVAVPSQTTTIVPRHVVLNETEERIIVRQCYLEDDRAGMFPINSKERKTLQLHDGVDKKRAFSSFENFIRKHRNDNDKSLIYIQFQLDESELGWSGPLCISSLGRFFLKFRKKSDQVKELGKSIIEFAAVHVAEEGSSLVVHFHKPPNVNLPYRIENCLRGASVTYYQKDSSEAEVLGSECSVDYVWDDLTLPHKLVVLINDMHTLREINLDKVRPWKPFFKLKQHRSLASYVAFGKKSGDQRTSFSEFNGMEIVKVGYEVRADGPTRILRICESSDSHKRNTASKFCAKIQLRISYFALHLLEHRKQDMDESDASSYAPIVVGRLGNINLDSVFRDQQKYNQISVQSLNVEHKRLGAPFAAMLRRHQLGYSESNDCVLKIVCILLSNNSNVKQVKYSSIILQPVDLNLDEETLMSIASFWRTSLSDSSTQSRQFYFDHFEILPIKIIANFLPGDSYSSYNSAQETVRSLLHSVVKVPSIKNMVVELNGVLVTHALITIRSPLLPPAFASIFDDSASSSLDVFFDPSYGLTNLPGLTLGSNVLFAAVTEISDSVLRGAETSGFDGLLYIEGYLQAMLDTMYRQEYLRVRVIDNQEWKIGPTVLTLCEHLFVSFAIRMLRRRADKLIAGIKLKKKSEADNDKAVVPVQRGEGRDSGKFIWKWGIGKFVLSGIIAYIDGRLCRGIPNPIARRIVGGFLLSFLDKRDNQ
ncbi:hypothetical protein CUMW_069730 [Citrus unshiu]|nr:hypothetical protein CUMW_069730 [Citrus unshiu]